MIPGKWFWLEKSIVHQMVPSLGVTALAIYAFLASMVDRQQRCFPSQKRMANSLGVSRSTVNTCIKVLRNHGLIGIEGGNGHQCMYQLLTCRAGTTGVSHGRDKGVRRMDTNKIQEKEEDTKKARRELLAHDLARGLENPSGLPVYRTYACRYPERLLRRLLSEVRMVPQERIRKSRAHLFCYRLKPYA